MKLLGWMHSKFRQNSGDVVGKDYSTGLTCNCLPGRPSLVDRQQPKNRGHPTTIDDDPHASNDKELLLEGLLSIGTLGSSPISEEQEEGVVALNVPNYEPIVFAFEEIADKEEGEVATETELMVVNAELEKVLIEAVEKEGNRMSSARPSHVSSGKANEVCPLQEYLLGSVAVEAAAAENNKEKTEKRASLGELFMIEEGEGKGEEKEGRGEVNAMLKKIKSKRHGSRREVHKSGSSGGGGGGGGGGRDATASNAKFHKILQMFHKKIHPEAEENMNSKKHMIKSSKSKSQDTTISSSFIERGDSLMISPHKRTLQNKSIKNLKHGSDQLPSGSTNKHGHWIKTDADYVVLEL